MKLISEWFYSDSLGSQSYTGSTSGWGPKTIFRYFTLIWKVTLGQKLTELVKNWLRDPDESL